MSFCLSRVVVVGGSLQGARLLPAAAIHTSNISYNKMGKVGTSPCPSLSYCCSLQPDPKLVLSSTTNNVTTLTMNDPKKLNGWTGPMMLTLAERFQELAKNPETKVRIVKKTSSG